MVKSRRPRLPTAGKARPRVRGVGSAQELGASRATTAYTAEEEVTDPATAEAIRMAHEGDDSVLLPYQPTPSINPPRPRTLAAGYDAKSQTLRVRFRDGAIYEYYDVPPRVWRNFRRVKSPGRAINRVLNNYDYQRMEGF